MTETATRMLRLMDRATAHWHFPVIGREHDFGADAREASILVEAAP